MVIAVLVIVIFLQRACSPVNPTPPTPSKPEIVTIIDTQYITKEVKKPVYVPGEVEFLPGDTLYEEVDTCEINFLLCLYCLVTLHHVKLHECIIKLFLKPVNTHNRLFYKV